MTCATLASLHGIGAEPWNFHLLWMRIHSASKNQHIEVVDAAAQAGVGVLRLLAARGVTEDDLAARVRAQIAAAVECDEPIVVRIAE